MKGNVFMQLESVASLVRKYQARWEFFVWSRRHTRTIGGESLPKETRRATDCAYKRVIQWWRTP